MELTRKCRFKPCPQHFGKQSLTGSVFLLGSLSLKKNYTMNLSKVDNLEIEYDSSDYPDFADASIISGDYDGKPLTDEQIDYLNENHHEFIYEKLMNHIF